MAKKAITGTFYESPDDLFTTTLDLEKIEDIVLKQIVNAVDGDENKAAEVMNNWFRRVVRSVSLLSLLQDGEIKITDVKGGEPCLSTSTRSNENALKHN